MGQGYSQDMHDQPLSQPNSPITNEHRPFRNPVNQRTLAMEFNMRLKYEGINAYGAQIFRDPLSRYYVKTSEFVTPLQQAPWVEYQEEQCIGEDGARYVLTAEPENVDTIGQPVKLRPAPTTKNHSSNERMSQPRLRTLNQVWDFHFQLLKCLIIQIHFHSSLIMIREKEKKMKKNLNGLFMTEQTYLECLKMI